MERLLTVSEVGQLLRVGKKNKLVYALVKKGILPGARVGNKLLIKESDVINYIDKCYEK